MEDQTSTEILMNLNKHFYIDGFNGDVRKINTLKLSKRGTLSKSLRADKSLKLSPEKFLFTDISKHFFEREGIENCRCATF